MSAAIAPLADVRHALEHGATHATIIAPRGCLGLTPLLYYGAMPGLPVGKLRAELLERLFDKHVPEDARVVVGPRVGEDAAVIPARDGGYCAIALSKRADPEAVFHDIPWSSEATLEATLERIQKLGLSAAVFDPSYDVDRPEDLGLLRDDLARRDPMEDDFPRATAAALAEIAPRSLA